LILALGATGAMLQFVTGALTSGVQRQLAVEIAHQDADRLRRVFSTSWVVFMGLGTVLWLAGVAITPIIMHGLTIPPERADAAWWVYQISLLSMVLALAITATPYRALLVARQLLVINALADVFTALVRLASVFLLLWVPWDWMVSYVAFQLIGYAVVRWSINGYCLWQYAESRPRPRSFDRAQLKEITRIATWTLLNQLSMRFRNQGGILLLNVFFGPVVNAGYGIAAQLSDYALDIAHAVRTSVLPAIVGAHAKGNRQSVHRLALVAGKYTVLLSSLIFVPIWLEAQRVLDLWLSSVPEYSVVFARLIIIWTLMWVFATGYYLALLATGDIGWYTRQNLYVSALILVISAIGFYFGAPPWFLPATTVVGMIVLTVIGVYHIGAQIDLPATTWFYQALLPTLGALVPATMAAAAVHWAMPDDNWRLLAVVAIYGVVSAPLIWWVALAEWERRQFFSFAKSAAARLQRAG
jgi:O-antigen/teichoic acid export membrane protein